MPYSPDRFMLVLLDVTGSSSTFQTGSWFTVPWPWRYATFVVRWRNASGSWNGTCDIESSFYDGSNSGDIARTDDFYGGDGSETWMMRVEAGGQPDTDEVFRADGAVNKGETRRCISPDRVRAKISTGSSPSYDVQVLGYFEQ